MEPTPSSYPSTFTLQGWYPTRAGNTTILVFDWCLDQTTGCESNSSAPPAVSSVTDNNSNSWADIITEADTSHDHIYKAMYACEQCGSGITSITVTFAAATIGDFHWCLVEVENLGALDGTPVGAQSITGSSLSAGSITLSYSGDFFIQDCGQVMNGLGYDPLNPSTNPFSGSPSPTWIFHDVILNEMLGYVVESSTGSKSISFSESGNTSNRFVCVAAAFQTTASGSGPAAGITPDIQYTVTVGASTSGQYVYVPFTTGELLVVYNEDVSAEPVVSDSATNSYVVLWEGAANWPAYAYSCGATGGDVGIDFKSSLAFFKVVAWRGIASSSCGDTSVSCTSPSSTFTSSGNIGCKNSGSAAPPWNNAPNITPSKSGLILATMGVGTGPNGVPTSPSGATFMCTTYSGETDSEKFCDGDAFAWLLATASTAETWDWPNANGSTSSSWNATAISFLPAAGVVRHRVMVIQQ
jgi:hypothetical protein